MAGRFEFLKIVREGPAWDQADVSRLWRFHLHYFDDLARLANLAAAGEPDAAFAAFRGLVLSWIEGNKSLAGDGWHPYTVSLRIVNWCEAGAFFARRIAADAAFDTVFHSSLYGQSRFLAGNLETDVGGNHLIKNLRALLWAGSYFEGPEPSRWRAASLSRLQRQTAEQILPDGAHFERVPSYHLQVVEDLRSCANLLVRQGMAQPWLGHAVDLMSSFIRAILPPSGRLPLLKDSTLDADLGVYVDTPQPTRFFPPSGYAVIRDDDRREFLIADFGIPCPDHLPAHAHADLFSFELTVGGEPVVVDSGVYEYEPGRWRDWFRSTAAHNTVEVAGRNQSEVWGSFRVAERAHPRRVHWVEQEPWRIVQGEHDGYERLSPPVTHRRTIAATAGMWLVIDELFGNGETECRSRIHLHPSKRAGDLDLVTFGGSVSSERGWYSERFGEKRENEVIVIECSGPMPLLFGYCIATAPAALMCGWLEGMPVLNIETASKTTTIALPRSEAPRIEHIVRAK
jgi:uncharacterized heparinase superfamily protein